MFLEVKIFKNRNPKVGFHPKIFLKSHQFLVISLTEVSRGPIVCREECIYKCIRICTTKWWLLKIDSRCKTTLGVRFFGFFTSRILSPYGTSHGWNFFFKISRLSMSSKSSLSLCPTKHKNDFTKNMNSVPMCYGKPGGKGIKFLLEFGEPRVWGLSNVLR